VNQDKGHRQYGDAGNVLAAGLELSVPEMDTSLERLNRLATLGTISATAAHEIKNSLVPVRTFIELLLEEKTNSELATVVRREVQRINLLLAQMLKLAAPSAPQLVPVPLHSAIENVLRLVRHSAALKSVQMDCQFNAAPDRVLGDGNQIEQVVLNLLINALEAVPQGGCVQVRTEFFPAEQEIEIAVCDNGPGMTKRVMDGLFTPFFTTKESGTGLGLSIVYQIVTAHQGRVWAESSPGEGSTFRVRLPCRMAD